VEHLLEHVVVVSLPGESIDSEGDEVAKLLLVLDAELERGLELSAIGGLRRLATLFEVGRHGCSQLKCEAFALLALQLRLLEAMHQREWPEEASSALEG